MDKGVSNQNKKKMTAAEKWDKIKAKKEGGIWKISYMMGFDMNWYWWESEKKNKSNKQSTIH